jgi:hypothetical protein
MSEVQRHQISVLHKDQINKEDWEVELIY